MSDELVDSAACNAESYEIVLVGRLSGKAMPRQNRGVEGDTRAGGGVR